MMDHRQPGTPPPVPGLASRPPEPPRILSAPRWEDSCFGAPILFDLTVVRDVAPPPPEAPVVYYLATPPPRRAAPFPWKTVVGFGSVVLGGVGLGLLLAALLLPV